MRTSGPYTITAGASVTLEPPSAGIRYVAVAIANASPYACTVQLARSGAAQWLQAWSADLYPLAEGDIATVAAALDTDTTGLIASGNVTATWYQSTDPITGTYPAALANPAVHAQVTGSIEVASGTITIGNTPEVVVQDGNITVPDAVLSGGGAVFGASNPSFTIRDVSAYSYGYQNPTASGGGGGTFVGPPPSGYNSTELHSLLIRNNGGSPAVYNLNIHGGATIISVELAAYDGFDFDFRGLSIGNAGLDFSCNGPGMLMCTYTWHA